MDVNQAIDWLIAYARREGLLPPCRAPGRRRGGVGPTIFRR